MSICPTICANGWPPGRRPKAISSLKSTSIRRASCDFNSIGWAQPKCSSGRRYAPPVDRLRASRNTNEGSEKSLPSFATAGHFWGRYLTPTRTELDGIRERSNARNGSDDVGRDPAHAGAGQADHAGGTGRQIEDATADERAAVVDGHDDAAVAMGHPELGTEREAAVGAGHGAGVHALA